MLPRRTFLKWRFPYLPCDATKRQMDGRVHVGNLERNLTTPSPLLPLAPLFGVPPHDGWPAQKLLCWLLSFLLGLVGS